MITTLTVEKDIEKIISERNSVLNDKTLNDKEKGAKITKLDNKLDNLNFVRRYLESKPSPEFISSEVSRIKALSRVYKFGGISNQSPNVRHRRKIRLLEIERSRQECRSEKLPDQIQYRDPLQRLQKATKELRIYL